MPQFLESSRIFTKEAFPGIDASEDFVVIAPVDASKPPRVGRQQDRLRIWAALGVHAILPSKMNLAGRIQDLIPFND